MAPADDNRDDIRAFPAHLVDAQSTVLSYADASYLIAVLGVLCIPLVLLLRKPRAARAPAEIAE